MDLSTINNRHRPDRHCKERGGTQELSDIEISRGANVEVGILGVIVPLIEGVFNPYAT